MITAIIFIFILGVLVFVHELGHFVVARRNGVKAEEFGFGFPPRLAGFVQNAKTKKYEFIWGNKDIESTNTIYSLNWIPLGGFVRIKGADTLEAGADSFVSKKAWPRIKILAAGVVMNFVLAWFLISWSLIIGAPEIIENNAVSASSDAKIQIIEVAPDSPADKAGIKIGDEILKSNAQVDFNSITDIQNFIKNNNGNEIIFNLKRNKNIVEIKIVPMEKDGQGMIGIGMAQTEIVKHSIWESIWKGAIAVLNMIWMIIAALGNIVIKLFAGHSVGTSVSGPVGIAVMTGQAATLGFVYILQFTAMLSVNLGIINALPIPALDGGRILFIIIEKIKGSPVTQKTEHLFHTIGFIILITLMILVTLRDVVNIAK